MKILYIDMLYDYGIKSRGLNPIGQMGFKKSLERLGHDVHGLYFDDYINSDNTPLQKEIINKAEELSPDLIFFGLYEHQFTIETLSYLKSKYTTINWFGDDQWRFDRFTKIYAPHFTYSVTTDRFAISKYHALGIKNVILAQWAAIDDERTISSLSYKYDVSFIGAKNFYRAWFVKELKKRNIHVHCFGNGWKNGPLNNDEMINLFRSSKINLNISNSISYDLRYLCSNPKHFIHTLRNKKNASQMKARNFEINYYAGFQLTDYAPGLEDYYHIGKEVACYSTIEDAVNQIKYFISNNQIREEIRDNGQKIAKEKYTYFSQLKYVLEQIK